MNDLQKLEMLLAADDPTPAAVAQSRRRLQERIAGKPARGLTARPVRGLRAAWLAGGTGAIAAAAVAVAVFSAAPAPPAAPPVVQSGPQVLLAAATVAERSPDATGTYWHVTITETGPGAAVTDYWVKPDGHWWFRGAKTGGKAMPMPGSQPFSLVGVHLTYAQLRALPTDPAALKAWIAEAETHSAARTSGGPFTAAERDRATFESLVSLVSTLPAPPAVRAAAFRAISEYPGVGTLGAVPGGQGLTIPPDGLRLVVDPATGRVNATSVYVTADGAQYLIAPPGTARVDAGWTDIPPQ
ncbi:CU044_5270 family protein [Amycolatopsis sp. NPDC050768]|uniref:CU044_5270 family protein n=1 Tax=unclassified Amycolatopsis TaxID=2618356 RepID=UPI001C69AF07|nr:CU044_5270 family protein [Amycolatopsis sp. DSM 110486]